MLLAKWVDEEVLNNHRYHSRWYVEVRTYDEIYGLGYHSKKVYLYRNDDFTNMPKCLKKAWKHYIEEARKQEEASGYTISIEVRAYIESEEGELHDLSLYWVMEQMECEERRFRVIINERS